VLRRPVETAPNSGHSANARVYEYMPYKVKSSRVVRRAESDQGRALQEYNGPAELSRKLTGICILIALADLMHDPRVRRRIALARLTLRRQREPL
jgi:hypothetical protein